MYFQISDDEFKSLDLNFEKIFTNKYKATS